MSNNLGNLIDFDKKSALDIANYITNNFKEEKED